MTGKVLSINLGNFGSTGKIMRFVSQIAEEDGFETYQAYPENKNNVKTSEKDIIICKYYFTRINERLAYYSGLRGLQATFTTLVFLNKVNKIKPDIVHLHNIHGNFINTALLFGYLKKHQIKVVWTLHDCWAFTGQCPYFDYVRCEKWKTGCYACEQLSRYPASKVDCTKLKWKMKRMWFTGIDHMRIVTPSEWLKNLVKQSYLKDYPVVVINNGIDLNIFKPTESRLREKYHLENKFVILGVAFDWEPRKGLDVFIKAAEVLSEDYKIILIGTNETIDNQLPDNIISVHRTQDQKELAQFYSMADLFVNPTLEENYPTVNMESLACGTPVLSYDTGGSAEIFDETCGCSIEKGNVSAMIEKTIEIKENKPFSREACVQRALGMDNHTRYRKYVELYHSIMGG